MDVLWTKIVVMVLWAALKMACGLLPVPVYRFFDKSEHSRTVDKAVGAVLCMGGGVLLATVFIHMLPEVQESLEHASRLGVLPADSHFPFAALFICVGFFVVYILEAVVHRIFHKKGHGHSHGLPPDLMTPAAEAPTEQLEMDDSSSNDSGSAANSAGGGGVDNAAFEADGSGGSNRTSIFGKSETFTPMNKKLGGGDNVYNVSSATLTSYVSHGGDSMDTSLPSFVPRPDKREAKKKKRRVSTAKDPAAREQRVMQTVRNLLVVMALSLHAVFEGMAVGLQMTNADVWTLFGAITFHMVPIHFCIGVDMLASGTRKLHILLYMGVMSLTSTLGVVVGIVVTERVDETSGAQALVIGVLQGIAGGTLLYVTFYEVLERSRLEKSGMTGLVGCFFVVAGFALLTAIEASGGGHSHGYEGGDHGHSHGGHDDDHGGHPGHPHAVGHHDHDHAMHDLQQGENKFGGHGHSHDGQDDDHDDHDHGHHDHDSHEEHHDSDHEDLDHGHDEHDHDHEEEDHDHEEDLKRSSSHHDHDHDDHDHDDHEEPVPEATAVEEHDHGDHDHDREDHDHQDPAPEEDHDHDHDHDHEEEEQDSADGHAHPRPQHGHSHSHDDHAHDLNHAHLHGGEDGHAHSHEEEAADSGNAIAAGQGSADREQSSERKRRRRR